MKIKILATILFLAVVLTAVCACVSSQPVVTYEDVIVKEYEYDPSRVWVAGWQKGETYDVALYFGSEILKDRTVLRDVEEMLIKAGYSLMEVKSSAERLGYDVDTLIEAIMKVDGEQDVLDYILSEETPVPDAKAYLEKLIGKETEVVESSIPDEIITPPEEKDTFYETVYQLAKEKGIDADKLYEQLKDMDAETLDSVLEYIYQAPAETVQGLVDILDEFNITLSDLAKIAAQDGMELKELEQYLKTISEDGDLAQALKKYLAEKLFVKETEEIKEEEKPEQQVITFTISEDDGVLDVKHETELQKDGYKPDIDKILENNEFEIKEKSFTQKYATEIYITLALLVLSVNIIGLVQINHKTTRKYKPKPKEGASNEDVRKTAAPIEDTSLDGSTVRKDLGTDKEIQDDKFEQVEENEEDVYFQPEDDEF